MRGIASGGVRGPAGPAGANGVGVPVGGTTGQVLAKSSNTDFDTGWINAATQGQPATGEYFYSKKLLYDNTLVAPGTWDVPNIPQDYDHLEIIIYGRRESSASATANVVNFNGDATAANYGWIYHYGGSTHATTYQGNTAYFGWVSGTTVSDSFATTFGTILNYSKSNSLKTLVGKSYFDESARYLSEEALRWASSAAINRISLVVAGGTNYAAGSRLQIFGVGNRPTAQGVSSAYVGEQLFRQVVGAGGQASFDISGIPGGYDRIEVSVTGKVAGSGGIDGFLLSLNGDTTLANYRRGYLLGGNSTGNGSDDSRYISGIPDSANANNVGTVEITLPDYSNTTANKSLMVHGRARMADNVNIYEYSAFWENTAAITRVTLNTNSGANFAEGTLCTVVGYRNRVIQSANSSAETVLANSFTLNAASDTYQDTGLSITLPDAGIYSVTCNIRWGFKGTGGAAYLVGKLYDATAGADLASSERLLFYAEDTTGYQGTVQTSSRITTMGSKIVKLYLKRVGSFTNSYIYSDTAGRTTMAYIRLE